MPRTQVEDHIYLLIISHISLAFLLSFFYSYIYWFAHLPVMHFEPPTLCQALRPILVSRFFSSCLKMCLK